MFFLKRLDNHSYTGIFRMASYPILKKLTVIKACALGRYQQL